MNIWNFWADKYERLWVQKYSLKPTRDYIVEEFKNIEKGKVLDIGSGPGQLLSDLSMGNKNLELSGLDFSQGMIRISKEKNPKAEHYFMNVEQLDELNEIFDYIISTHSLPYYKNLELIVEKINNLLSDDGRFFIAFASGDSCYDKLVLSFVKLTTGPANYPSDREFRRIVSPYFEVEKMQIIRIKKYMPRIAVYTLSKLKEGKANEDIIDQA